MIIVVIAVELQSILLLRDISKIINGLLACIVRQILHRIVSGIVMKLAGYLIHIALLPPAILLGL